MNSGKVYGLFRVALSSSLLVFTLHAFGQSYPIKPIRLVLVYPAGGGIDILARPLAQALSDSLGQSVIVDHRGGADGAIAMELVAKARPDGYTIIMAVTAQLAIHPALHPKLAYDPIRDFAPITLLGSAPYVLVVYPSLPVKSLQELIALARSKPGQLNYASVGSGSGAHLSTEMLKTIARIDMIHVPNKSTASALLDVITGQVQLMVVTYGAAGSHILSGRLRALAVTSGKRTPVAPTLPTVAESGLPGYESVVWYGVLAPGGTPKDIIAKLNGEILRVLSSSDYRKYLAAGAVDPSGSTPEQFYEYIKSEIVKWGKVVKDSGATAD